MNSHYNKPVYQHDKGWGHEDWLHNDERYCFKRLVFKDGGKTSLHFHILKHETFYVVSGVFALDMVDQYTAKRRVVSLAIGDWQVVPPGIPHRLRCATQHGGTVLEASTQHLEDDSYRIEPGDSQTPHKTKGTK